MLEQVHSIPWRLCEAIRPRRSTALIGMPPGVHLRLRAGAEALAERVRERYELKRRPGVTPALVPAVREGKVALTLARLPVSGRALGQVLLMSERLGAVVPADRFASRSRISTPIWTPP
ncbi:hypothetical protein [Streptomyces sp. NPDC047079]|uniref:hypothetical protein n=1 Tax=Streptomyces sp. NPDC047079 TaxID=3154607 RepID=UPI0033E42A26